MTKRPWYVTWSPFLSNGVHRLDFLMQVRATVQLSRTRTTRWIDHDLVVGIINYGVLNAGQIGGLLGITPQQIRNIARKHGGLVAAAPRGVFNSYDLDYIFLMVQRLSRGMEPMNWMLEAMPYAGDPAIVSYLTGVPEYIIVKYRRSKEAADATDHIKRMASEYQFHQSVHSAAG